jgi:hypothetical protein
MLEFHFENGPYILEGPTELPMVRLPMLQSLALKHTIHSSISWELGLLKMLDAPDVKSFQLYLASNRTLEANPIVDYIANQDKANDPRPMFPLLTDLGFFAQWDITSDLRKLLSTHPDVTTLILPEFPELTALMEAPWLAPSLALLSVETKEYDILRNLLILRRRECLPLKTVELKKHTGIWAMSLEEKKELEDLANLVLVDELEDRMFSMLVLDKSN